MDAQQGGFSCKCKKKKKKNWHKFYTAIAEVFVSVHDESQNVILSPIFLNVFFSEVLFVLSVGSRYITSLRGCLCCLEGSWERKRFLSEVSSLFTLGNPPVWPQL